MREGESIKFFVKIYLYHIAENFPRENFLVVHSIWVSKNFAKRRGVSRFSVDFFCLRVRKIKFRGGTF